MTRSALLLTAFPLLLLAACAAEAPGPMRQVATQEEALMCDDICCVNGDCDTGGQDYPGERQENRQACIQCRRQCANISDPDKLDTCLDHCGDC
jgi:hypothetical protein